MHTRSGLLAAIQASPISLAEGGRQTLEFLRAHIAKPRTVPLCGNSIGTDRRFLAAHLPDVEDFSLYRVIAAEDPFPYSDSLHLDFLHRFGPEDVWAVLRGLPETYRLPLVLVHMHDVTTKHAARLLDVPLGTLLARLHRGRKLFEKDLWVYAEHHDLLREPVREGT